MTSPEPQVMYRLPASLADDLAKLREMVSQVQAGELSHERFRAFRVPMGIYEQRENGTFMLRVRLPAGGVLPHQMRTLADVSEQFGNGVLHVTTRQDIQVHGVLLGSIPPAEDALCAAGLTTKGGGGNTVRNIVACPHAGVCAREAFDVTPCALALTEFLLPDPLSYQLPRKYKIALSGCGADCAGASVNDLGLIAKKRDGVQGFAIHAGGGMGARSRVADLLEDFVPASEIHLVAEAVKRVFDKHGNRRDKHKARLRFLVEAIGFDAFRELYEQELAALRADPPPGPELRPLPHPKLEPAAPAATARSEDFRAWREHNVSPQKQDGYHVVEIALELGDVDAGQFAALADVAERYGERMVRTTQQQNIVLRWVHEDELAAVHGALAVLGLADVRPAVLRNLVACAGASTCRLGICLSRGLAEAIGHALADDGGGLHALGPLAIQISGCPNSCGRHRIAQIGLSGAARRVGGRLVPYYVVQLGGRVAEGATRLAEGHVAIPARNVQAFLKALLEAFSQSPQRPDFDAFLDAGGRELADRLLAEHAHVPSFETNKSYYTDWSAAEPFSLAGRGPGECSVGVFDFIEVDLASAADALDAERLHTATVLAARALLVTRGEEPKNDREALEMFRTHFVEAGLVTAAQGQLVERAVRAASAQEPERAFEADAGAVGALVAAVKRLYESMDNSLRFTAPPPQAAPEIVPAATKDLRGVACPLNYVKVKLALEQLGEGDVLSVALGEDGATNVPASSKADGHEVLSVAQQGDHWRVLIRKGKRS